MATPSAQMRIIQKKIERAVFQAQKKAARELIQVIIDAIRTRTRLLKELADGSSIPEFRKNKKTQEQEYVKYRERYSSNLDADTTPKTSNATATGQMLNSMTGKSKGSKITITLKDKRGRELNGKTSGLKNSQVNKFYEESKGEWFELQDKEREEAIDYATEIIKEEIKNVLK